MTERLRRIGIPAVFTLTLFLSAGLLFCVEPMVAKMILPLLGGTPAVWNTCMMFFQIALLGGYLYAHITSNRLGAGQQIVVHGTLLVLAFMVLPITISRQWLTSGEAHPIGTVLILLLTSVGLPFFILSASAPLLQRWFSSTDHPSAGDPYFLYSASNLGSMLALISYPAIIEPYLSLRAQSTFWTAAYGMLAALTLGCAFIMRRAAKAKEKSALGQQSIVSSAPDTAASPSVRTRLRWIVLAFIPSSLMLGVTTFISTDIAAIPLLWVIPLSLYLLSFILVFARIPGIIHRIMVLLAPIAVVMLLAVNFSSVKPPIVVLSLLNLAAFFVIAMVCHGELARSRPAARHLTGFYLWMSLGGMLGGVFNAVLAPVIFNAVIEYPLVLAVAALFLPAMRMRHALASRRWLQRCLDLGLPLLLGIVSYWLLSKKPITAEQMTRLAALTGADAEDIAAAALYIVPAVLCWCIALMNRSLRFGLGVCTLVMVLLGSVEWERNIVHRERSFFGVITVSDATDGKYRYLVHGRIQHGKQCLDPARCREPLTYYHRKGPVGQLFKEFSGPRKKSHIALIGLGAGTLASYGSRGQQFTFYEIDPVVKRVATNPALFTYLKHCRAEWRIVMGDARLKLESAPEHHYGLMFVDAFSSDAIPVHLLTREAFRLYFSKLEERGVLAVHISNKYLDLEPVVKRLAADAGLASRIQNDEEEDTRKEKYRSTWVILARKDADFGRLAQDTRWTHLNGSAEGPVWTDDFSNILSVFKWGPGG
ncbi:MAG: fused MFS/spermidine synthase [Nitrospirota bacterium]